MVGGLARRGDRALDVLGAGVGHLGEFAFGRGLDIRKARAARRRDVPTSDEQIGFHFGRLAYLNDILNDCCNDALQRCVETIRRDTSATTEFPRIPFPRQPNSSR